MYSLLWVKSLVPGQVGWEGVSLQIEPLPMAENFVLVEVYLHWTASGYTDWCSI